MESSGTWEYASLITELTQGMDKAKQLRFHLCLTSPTEPESLLLLQRVMSSFEKALMILKWKGVEAGQLGQLGQAQMAAAPGVSSALESSISVDGSPRSDELNRRDHLDNGTPKKRKLQPTWTEQVKVNSDNGLEGPADDGYSWRKYGQKDILGAKYPRSYYRCTYRAVKNCWATKQVQRSDDDPLIFEVTYRGSHTCNHLHNGIGLPASPEKPEVKHNHQIMRNFKANLRVSTENLDSNETPPTVFSFPSTYPSNHIDSQYYLPVDNFVDDNHLGGYSPLFLSPDTSESNYLSPAICQIMNFAGTTNYQHSESDIGEILSTNASTTNSPIGGIDFLIDTAEQDPNFPFNTAGFFP